MPENTTTETQQPQGDPKADETKSAEQPLGEPGKKALESERAARKKAEEDLTALRTEFDGFRSQLGEAFGVKPSADKGDGDTLQQVQQQLAQMQHESAVYRLAAQHQITDDGDLELLKAASGDAMPRLAERLAAKAEAETKPGTPKPDATQGGKAGESPALNSNALEQALKSKLGIV